VTLAELHDIYSKGAAGSTSLLDKITAAVMKSAETIRTELASVTNHANRMIWAKQAFQNPTGKANEMWVAVLAANAGSTQSAVLGASDSAIQTNVDAAVDVFATGV